MTGAGEMDRRVVLQSGSESRDGVGQPVVTWSTLATVWAKREAAGAREPFTEQQFAAFEEGVWTIYYRSDITLSPKLRRLVDNGKTFDLTAVQEVGRRQFLRLRGYARAEA